MKTSLVSQRLRTTILCILDHPSKVKRKQKPAKITKLDTYLLINYMWCLIMRHKRKTMDKPASLGSILSQVLSASNVEVDLNTYRLWKEWPQLVGPAIARNTRPEAIKGKLLLVNVSSAPWLQQLQYLKCELIEKLNKAFGKKTVGDIRFKIGPIE